MKRRISKTKYLTVFSLTTLIFIIGLVIGHQIANTKLSKIEDLSQSLKTDTMAMELQYLLLSEDPCSDVDVTYLSEELYELGEKLDYMESRLGKKNKQVLMIKEYYSLLEIRHWLFMKKIKKECSQNQTLILYFYSNMGDCSKCQEQGFVLNYIHKKFPEIAIYSFDINSKNVALATIKKMFDVKDSPTLVINEDTHQGFKTSTEIEDLI